MAFYINLDRRTDRRAEFEGECSRMGLQVERFPAIVHPLGGGHGCASSHLQVLKLARKRRYVSVMIFEDDFEFLVSKDEFARVVSSLPHDYDVVMFGYNLFRGEEYTPQFGRTLEAQTTSGYIVHHKAYNRLIAQWEHALSLYMFRPDRHWIYACDQSWKPLQPLLRWYHTLPRVGKQRAGWSDLVQQFVDYTI